MRKCSTDTERPELPPRRTRTDCRMSSGRATSDLVDRFARDVEKTAWMTESWTCRHFAQRNPEGDGQGDVPALLRRVADSIEALGVVSVQDVVFHTEVTAEGPWHGMTVYFHDGDIYEGEPEPSDRD